MRFRVTITGTAPLLMHNGRLANPLDPSTQALKALTSKRKKTDDDLFDIARAEFLGGLYIDPDVGPFIPGENIERTIRDGATLTKNGMNVKRGLFIETDVNPLAYTGPRTAEALWDDENFRLIRTVRNQQNRGVPHQARVRAVEHRRGRQPGRSDPGLPHARRDRGTGRHVRRAR